MSAAPFAIVDRATPTLVEMLQAAIRGNAVEAEWRLSDAGNIATLWLERGGADGLEWTAIHEESSAVASAGRFVDRDPSANQPLYRLHLALRDGGQHFSSGVSVAIGGQLATPVLGLVSPDPASLRAMVSYTLPRASMVELSLVDLQGRQIAVLANGSRGPGAHSVSIFAADLPVGIYFARLKALDHEFHRRFVVLR